MDTVTQNPHFEFMNITGVVLQSSNWSETHVSGGGGGGSHGVTHINAVKSKVVSHGEIWVRDESGKEHHLRFSGGEVPTRSGHILTALYARPSSKKKDEYFPVAYYNHTTGTLTKLEQGIADIAYKSLHIARHGGVWLGLLWFVFLVGAFASSHPGKAFEGLLILGFIFWFISAIITAPQVELRKKKLNKILNGHFQNVPRVDAASYANAAAAPAA